HPTHGLAAALPQSQGRRLSDPGTFGKHYRLGAAAEVRRHHGARQGRRSMSRIRVLIVDASPVTRQTLTAILTSDPDIEVTGVAADPYIAARRIQKEVPDVIILGVDLPRMDGITFLRKLMAQRPLPVVMCSSMADEGSQALIEALDAGAVDVILKPEVGSREFLMESQVRICDVVKAAAVARIP